MTLTGTLTQNFDFPFRPIEPNSEIPPWSQAMLMAEGHWGLDWEVTDSGGVRGSNLSPGYLSDSWHRQQEELWRRLGRVNHSCWPDSI